MFPLEPLKVLLTIPIVLIAIFFLSVSALVIIRDRPLMLSEKTVAWLVTVCLALILVANVILSFSVSDITAICFGIFMVIVLSSAGAAMHYLARGYFVIGVEEESFRDSLRTAFNNLNLNTEESLLGFQLTSLGIRLQARTMPQVGSAQFRLADRGHTTMLAQIARQVNSCLQIDSANVSTTAALVFGGFGLFFLIIAVYQWLRL